MIARLLQNNKLRFVLFAFLQFLFPAALIVMNKYGSPRSIQAKVVEMSILLCTLFIPWMIFAYDLLNRKIAAGNGIGPVWRKRAAIIRWVGLMSIFTMAVGLIIPAIWPNLASAIQLVWVSLILLLIACSIYPCLAVLSNSQIREAEEANMMASAMEMLKGHAAKPLAARAGDPPKRETPATSFPRPAKENKE